MNRLVEDEDRTQSVLLPELLDDYVAEDNPVRVIDVFVDEVDLRAPQSMLLPKGIFAVSQRVYRQ